MIDGDDGCWHSNECNLHSCELKEILFCECVRWRRETGGGKERSSFIYVRCWYRVTSRPKNVCGQPAFQQFNEFRFLAHFVQRKMVVRLSTANYDGMIILAQTTTNSAQTNNTERPEKADYRNLHTDCIVLRIQQFFLFGTKIFISLRCTRWVFYYVFSSFLLLSQIAASR